MLHTAPRTGSTHFHGVFGTSPNHSRLPQVRRLSTDTKTTSSSAETSKQIQMDGKPFCLHRSSQTLQTGWATAEVGTQANSEPRCLLTLVPETWSVRTQDDARYNVGSAPIGPGGTDKPVITLLSHRRSTYCLTTQGPAWPGVPVTMSRPRTRKVDGITTTDQVLLLCCKSG